MKNENSKYQAEWKEFERNEAFWNEVFVMRRIMAARYSGAALTGAKARLAQHGMVKDLDSNHQIVLDTGEIVYLTGKPDWGHLDLIAPTPTGLVGQMITEIEWDEEGIAALVLEHGRIGLDKARAPGRLWINDGVKHEEGPLAPAVKAMAESIAMAEDERFLSDVMEVLEEEPSAAAEESRPDVIAEVENDDESEEYREQRLRDLGSEKEIIVRTPVRK